MGYQATGFLDRQQARFWDLVDQGLQLVGASPVAGAKKDRRKLIAICCGWNNNSGAQPDATKKFEAALRQEKNPRKRRAIEETGLQIARNIMNGCSLENSGVANTGNYTQALGILKCVVREGELDSSIGASMHEILKSIKLYAEAAKDDNTLMDCARVFIGARTRQLPGALLNRDEFLKSAADIAIENRKYETASDLLVALTKGRPDADGVRDHIIATLQGGVRHAAENVGIDRALTMVTAFYHGASCHNPAFAIERERMAMADSGRLTSDMSKEDRDLVEAGMQRKLTMMRAISDEGARAFCDQVLERPLIHPQTFNQGIKLMADGSRKEYLQNPVVQRKIAERQVIVEDPASPAIPANTGQVPAAQRPGRDGRA